MPLAEPPGKPRLWIIIDTDPGVDDSMAILLAFNSPEIDVEGLTTVFGNTGTEITTKNALRLVELAGRPDILRRFKQEHPEVQVVPRTRVELVDELLAAGAGVKWRVCGAA